MTDKPKGGFEKLVDAYRKAVLHGYIKGFSAHDGAAEIVACAALLAHHAALERELELKGLDILQLTTGMMALAAERDKLQAELERERDEYKTKAFLAKFDALNTANEVNAKLQAELAEARAEIIALGKIHHRSVEMYNALALENRELRAVKG